MSTNGVVIPQKTIQDSEQKKRQHRTLRQMPIYRDIANLKYFVVCLYERVPRKFTRYIDSILLTVSEAKKCVGLAHATRDSAMRIEYLDMVHIFVEDVQDDIKILHKMNHISKDTENKIRQLTRGIVAQAIALRDYTSGQGNS